MDIFKFRFFYHRVKLEFPFNKDRQQARTSLKAITTPVSLQYDVQFLEMNYETNILTLQKHVLEKVKTSQVLY